jgi:hypothetical protein
VHVADGPEVSIAVLHHFATLTWRCELVHLGQRLLNAAPEFAVRRAMELAGLVLTLKTVLRFPRSFRPLAGSRAEHDAMGFSPSEPLNLPRF